MVVPTWNYVVVHAHGELRAIEDREWLRDFVQSLTKTHEAGQKEPWEMSNAPADYIEKQLGVALYLSKLRNWKSSNLAD